MKKIIIFLIAISILGCVPSKQVKPDKEMSDKVWDELSKDLSNVYVLVQSVNKNLEIHRSELQVNVENWKYPIGEKISIATASKIKSYPIIKMGSAKIPTAMGIVASDLFKTHGKDGIIWFATKKNPDISSLITASASSESIKLENKYIPLYTYGPLNDESKAIPVIKQIVYYDALIDKAYKKVTEALERVEKKYRDSPVYIEGFMVHIGINFSVEITFKFKR